MNAPDAGIAACVTAALAAGAVLMWPPGNGVLDRIRGGPGGRGPLGARDRGDWGDLADRLAAGVAAGLPLHAAWSHAVGGGPLPPARKAHDRAAVAGIAAALELSEALGIPPVEPLRAVASGVRDARAVEDARAAAVAGPAAAARVVAVLPAAGPLLGVLLGVDPFGVLLGTLWGRMCLGGGLGFLALAAWWSHRLLRRARTQAQWG